MSAFLFRENKKLRDVLSTIAYYDAFGMALTDFEIWKNLISSEYFLGDGENGKISLLEIKKLLDDPRLTPFLGNENGFYFLRGKDKLAGRRILRGKTTERKLQRMRFLAKVLAMMPFVRMVAVTGGVAIANAKNKSDLDMLIVCKTGRIWIARTLVSFSMHVLGQRRHGKKVRDRACLNYFLSEDALEIRTKDLFSANEYHLLLPIYDSGAYEYFQMKNHWIRSLRPNYELSPLPAVDLDGGLALGKFIQRFGEMLLDFNFLENILGHLEKLKIKNNPKTKLEGALIDCSNEALIFLPEPKGPKIFDKFKENLDKLL